MKVLITGGAGYIGTKLVKLVVDQSEIDRIIVYDNLSKAHYNFFLGNHFNHGEKIQVVQGDILDTRQLKKFMKDVEKYALKEDVLVNQRILYGNPAEELLNLMKKKKFDLIVVGRRGTTKITGPSLGSVSNALVQSSKVPVLVVG